MSVHPVDDEELVSLLKEEHPVPWRCDAKNVFIVDSRDSVEPYDGPWKKSLRLRVELKTPIPIGTYPAGLPVFISNFRAKKRLLAISDPVFYGIWSILVVSEDRYLVHCLVKHYDTDTFPKNIYDVVVPTTGRQNLTVVKPPDGVVVSPSSVAIAPPLYFTTRTSIFTVDEISTMNQNFRAKGFCELRLRDFSDEDDDDLANKVLEEYTFDVSMIGVLDIVEHVCDEEKSMRLMFRDGKYEMVFTMIFHVVLPETFELHRFPFDDQDLSVVITLHHPEPLTKFLADPDNPSLFAEKGFRFQSEFHVSFKNQIRAEVYSSDPSESIAASVYPRMKFTLNLRRRPEYVLVNIVLPMLVLTSLTSISIGFRTIDGPRMDTADRLSVTLTLLLTAVAFKLVMASEMPQVSYLTTLDKYLLGCNLWILVAALENVAYPTWGYDRSGDEPKERFDEWYIMCAYLGLFLGGNGLFWRKVFLHARTRIEEITALYEAEKIARQANAAKRLSISAAVKS
mmetsp:Transcript_28419/g.58147  ORF Transcript_28419/g.58147 Transcript_28419/m.58147 type:complete len:510 (+) Transcript_28419:80-1609(+)|eukprot:CAMPEP_0171912672 /NCGR_PEP_ID=MMETSP0993-20121228/11294_1 /TAXON_ID=483369 /ORGANISM="non described non described, Strain CCMP2098" /LENGTH=509 /DNA_ID=CAMNT_0012546563 /DNA_START=46 /DNA_END=1575 /DNA_ORIENTATION=-